jgi:nitroreductase
MTILDLSVDEVLSTTRSVRKRLDLTRPVEPELIRECLELAAQAPTGSNSQTWHFIVVTDQEQRKALGEIYRKGWALYRLNIEASGGVAARKLAPEQASRIENVVSSSQHLADHMGEVPVLVVPCIYGRTDNAPSVAQAGTWGSILPAAWSFMLAARERGLGTCWTTLHLFFEQEAAELLGIPYEKIMQTALIPVAHTLGTEFKPGLRVPMDKIVHWDRW